MEGPFFRIPHYRIYRMKDENGTLVRGEEYDCGFDMLHVRLIFHTLTKKYPNDKFDVEQKFENILK